MASLERVGLFLFFLFLSLRSLLNSNSTIKRIRSIGSLSVHHQNRDWSVNPINQIKSSEREKRESTKRGTTCPPHPLPFHRTSTSLPPTSSAMSIATSVTLSSRYHPSPSSSLFSPSLFSCNQTASFPSLCITCFFFFFVLKHSGQCSLLQSVQDCHCEMWSLHQPSLCQHAWPASPFC